MLGSTAYDNTRQTENQNSKENSKLPG